MARRVRRERMRVLIERWRRSGETAAAFCRRQGIDPQRLSYWKRVLGMAAGRKLTRQRRRAAGFVPVRLVDVGSAAGNMEILLAGGDRLVVHEGVSRELLRDALTVLRERC